MNTKFIIVLFLIILFGGESKGQVNLVKNSSFEQYSICPIASMELDKAVPWFQPNIAFGGVLIGSTDYFNSCSTLVGVPSNSFGFQYAKTGNSYAGFAAFVNIAGINKREYLEVELIDSLISGKNYEVSFWLSLSEISDCATSTIGAYFSTDTLLYNDINQYNIAVLPQIESDSLNILEDTLNWIEIKKTYLAQGAERFITIGNFRDNLNTPFIQIKDTTTLTAYYYIDDISVVCTDCLELTTEIAVPNAFSPNGDGHNDLLRVLGSTAKIEFKIFNRWGELVYSFNGTEMNAGQGWDGTYNGSALNNGVFTYYASATMPDGKEVSINGNVSLIK
jgi:OOP family OmpA-OmpF porin